MVVGRRGGKEGGGNRKTVSIFLSLSPFCLGELMCESGLSSLAQGDHDPAGGRGNCPCTRKETDIIHLSN